MSDVYTSKYWLKTSKNSYEYQKIYDIYISGANRGQIMPSSVRRANPMIKRIMHLSNKMYRFYNDGDSFTYKGRRIDYKSPRGAEETIKEIDLELDKLVSGVWNLTNGATL